MTDGVENTLKEVPANQVILGMPFYTRVWSETPVESDSTATDETDTTVDYELSSYATNMTEVQKLISANGVQPVWLDDIGQNYVEYQNGGVNYKIWIEDATSLEKKQLVFENDPETQIQVQPINRFISPTVCEYNIETNCGIFYEKKNRIAYGTLCDSLCLCPRP